MHKICNTLQGQLYKAKRISDMDDEKKDVDEKQRDSTAHQYVAIKRIDKELFQESIAIQDDMNFIVSENIIKEAFILKYLTVDNCPIGDYICKYIDFFESDDYYYLVIEYVYSEINLWNLYQRHAYINDGKLELRKYQKIIKYILWQLFVTVNWMHNTVHCM